MLGQFESRAIHLIQEFGLIVSHTLTADIRGELMVITLDKLGTDIDYIEYVFEFPFNSEPEDFWEQVVNRLEIAHAINEI